MAAIAAVLPSVSFSPEVAVGRVLLASAAAEVAPEEPWSTAAGGAGRETFGDAAKESGAAEKERLLAEGTFAAAAAS